MQRSILTAALGCILLFISSQGIGQQAKKNAASGGKAKSSAKAVPGTTTPEPPKAAPKAATKPATQKPTPAIPRTPAKNVSATASKYIPEDLVAVAAIQPLRILNSQGFRSFVAKAKVDDLMADLIQQAATTSGLDVSKLAEVVVLLDAATMKELEQQNQKAAAEALQKNGLKQVGLAMHNFHEAFNSFPDDDGFGDSKGNLSWRVHLLPYLEQQELYGEFHLDEPWDSDHNKALIEKMPDVFKSSGVEEKGRTAIHLLTGEGTPFGGDDAPGIRDIIDGTSNTILTVNAGSNTAEVWTKPGGLEISPEDPVQALGNVGDRFVVGLMDGSVQYFEKSMEAQTFLHAAQHQDGSVVTIPYEYSSRRTPSPSLIIRTSEPMDAKAVTATMPISEDAGKVVIGSLEAMQLYSGEMVLFPDPQTMLFGREESLKQMMAKRGKSGSVKAEFEALYPANDAAAVVEFGAMTEQLAEMMQEIPFAGLVESLASASATIDFVGNNESMVAIDVTTDDAASAGQITGVITGGYEVLKVQAMAAASMEEPGFTEEGIEILSEIMESVKITSDKNIVSLDLAKPENGDAVVDALMPLLDAVFTGMRESIARSKEAVLRNPIREMGLALHNYHDAFNGFPSWDTPRGDSENKGLSWRVHLLPYFDEADLYNQFHLDEPWDSEHNKALIEKMPELFKCEGVEEAGHTSYHVFLGESTPFGGEAPNSLSDITDGSSNTIMIVKAGASTADVWTKPSGLEYDPENPLECLGNIGDRFLFLLCDGSSRFVDSSIEPGTFRRLIEMNDGEVIGDF